METPNYAIYSLCFFYYSWYFVFHKFNNTVWVIPCQVMQAWKWPISKFDKNFQVVTIYKM